MQQPYLDHSGQKPSAASLLLKVASEKNAAMLREKTVEENRELKQKLAAVRLLSHMDSREIDCGGIPCEWIFPRAAAPQAGEAVILYLHGGSWAFGNRKTAKAMGALMAETAHLPVLVAEYRLAPEHPYPAGLTDCLRVYRWLLDSGYAPGHIALLGDSAGGNLSLCLLQLLREKDLPFPACLCLASPVTDLRESSALAQSGTDLLYSLYQGQEHTIFQLYLAGQDPAIPSLSPILGELGDLPPTLIHTGGDEPLSRDNEDFARLAWEAGAPVRLKLWEGMFHDFSVVGLTLKESRQSIGEFSDFIRLHLR